MITNFYHMNKISNIFPLDIFSIKKLGVESWHKNFYWPVTINEYEQIENSLLDSFDKIYSIQENNKIMDSLWVLYPRLLANLCLLIHNKLVLDRISNKTIAFDYNNTKCNKITISNYYWDILINNKKIKFPPIENTFFSTYNYRLRAKVSSIKNLFLNYGLTGIRPKMQNNNLCFVIEPISSDMIDYSKQKKKTIIYIDPYKYKLNKIPKIEEKDLNGVVELFIENIIKDYKTMFSTNQTQQIKSSFKKQVQLIININAHNSSLYKGNKFNSFFAMRLGNPLIRSVAISCMRNGINAYGFTHGNYIGFHSERKYSNIFFGCVNNFVAPSKASAKLFSNSSVEFNKIYNKKINISYIIKNSAFNRVNQNVRHLIKPSVIKKVLLVEFGLGFDHQSWPFYLDFILNIGKTIRTNSQLISMIKRRPERLEESKDVYNQFFDKCIDKPFEDVFGKADIIIFPRITTTTFGFSLFTNLPIIIFSHSLVNVNNETINDLYQRCNVINSSVCKKGKIRFDENKLLKVLNGDFISSTANYINKYCLDN